MIFEWPLGLTRDGDAKDENAAGNDKNDGGYPAHRADVVSIDRDITSATVRFRLNVLLSNWTGALPLSIFRWRLVLVLRWGDVPIGSCKVEAGNIAASSVQFLERALFGDLAFFPECDDMVTIRKTFGCVEMKR
jgi:hypothetical protein